MTEDLIIIASWHSFISKEVYLLKVIQKFETIGLVPAFWENIKTNLTSNRKLQFIKILLTGCNELLSNFMNLIKSFKFIPFLLGAISSNWAHIKHPISEFNECTPLDWNIDLRQIFEAKIYEFLEFFFPKFIFQTIFMEEGSILKTIQSIFSKQKINFFSEFTSELPFDFLKIRTANNSNIYFFLQFSQRIDHILLNFIHGLKEGSIDIEQTDYFLASLHFRLDMLCQIFIKSHNYKQIGDLTRTVDQELDISLMWSFQEVNLMIIIKIGSSVYSGSISKFEFLNQKDPQNLNQKSNINCSKSILIYPCSRGNIAASEAQLMRDDCQLRTNPISGRLLRQSFQFLSGPRDPLQQSKEMQFHIPVIVCIFFNTNQIFPFTLFFSNNISGPIGNIRYIRILNISKMAQPINLNELMEEMLKSRDGVGENSIVYQNGVKALKEGRNHDAINYFTEELDKIREKFGKGKFPLEPKLLRLIGNAHLNLNDPSEAGKSVQAAVQLYKTLKFSHDAELAECYCLKGQIYVMNKLYEKAAKKFDRQAKLLQKFKPCPTLETVRASLEAAKLYSITNQTSSADGHFSIALNLLYAKADKEQSFISFLLLITALKEMNVTHGLEEGLSTLYEAILALDQQKNYNDIGELYIFLTQLRDLNATKVAEFTRILDQFPSNKRTEKVTTAAAFVYLLLADALFERSMSDQGKSLQLKTHKIPGIDLSVQSIIDKEMVSHKDYLPPSLNLKKIDSTNADELERRGHEHLALNQYEEGATLLNKSRIKKVELFGEKNYEILSIDTTLLSVYQRIGNIDKGRECFDKILGKVKNANFTKEVAKAIEFIVDYAIEIGEYTQAQELATQNLIKNSVLFGQTSQEVARAYQQLGTIYFRESNILSAETHARKAYNIIQNSNDKHSRVLPRSALLLAQVSLQQDELIECERLINENMIYFRDHPEEDDLIWETYEVFGGLKMKQDKPEEGLIEIMKSLSEKLLKYGDNHLKVASTYRSLGDLFFAQKNYTDAKINYQKSFAILNGKFKGTVEIGILQERMDLSNKYIKGV